MGELQETIGEGLLFSRVGTPQHTGDKPGHRLDNHQGRDLPTHEDIVTDGYLHVNKVPDPLINPFIPSTDYESFLKTGYLTNHPLMELGPLGGDKDNLLSATIPNRLYPPHDGVNLHYHSGPAAIGGIIGASMPVEGIIPRIMESNLQEPPLYCLSHKPLCEG